MTHSNLQTDDHQGFETGHLVVVGTGIMFGGHLTPEAKAAIETADEVYYAVADPAIMVYLQRLNPKAKSLCHYLPDVPRSETYEQWIKTLIERVQAGQKVCGVFYGHPGVFVYSGHKAIQLARKAGYNARMLPGISAEDCLFADLLIDPSIQGCQSFEATDFLIRDYPINVNSPLILWQIALVGQSHWDGERCNRIGLRVLAKELICRYGEYHEVAIYEAAQYAIYEPNIQIIHLEKLEEADVTVVSTLFVPPLEAASLKTDRLKQLGIEHEFSSAPSLH